MVVSSGVGRGEGRELGTTDGGRGRVTFTARVIVVSDDADAAAVEVDPGVKVTMGEILLVPAGSYVYVSSRRSSRCRRGSGVACVPATGEGNVGEGRTCCRC